MKFFQEITPGDQYPNHVYLLTDNKEFMVGYIPTSTGQLKQFASKYRFDTKGRKFKEVVNSWGWAEPEAAPKTERWEIKGSKGDVYTVEREDGELKCSCSGFRFRGKCKHIDQIGEQNG